MRRLQKSTQPLQGSIGLVLQQARHHSCAVGSACAINSFAHRIKKRCDTPATAKRFYFDSESSSPLRKSDAAIIVGRLCQTPHERRLAETPYNNRALECWYPAPALASLQGFVLNGRLFMRTSYFIARTVTQRRPLVWCGVAVLIILCLTILFTSLRLDSEIFNVLPGKFPSVQGLKIYDHDFEQTRELTFALVCDPQDADKLEEFAPVFAERLRGQSWCARVLAGSPMTTADGIRDLQSIAVPLLLNLEPSAFDEAMSILQPDKIRDRLRRLRQQIEAGSPGPQFGFSFHPLGLITPAIRPFAEGTAIQQNQPLTSSDRTLQI